MELAAVLEGVGVADVEQQLPFHRANRLDARRHALAQALAHQIAAVGEPLERVIRRAILPQAQERIEAVQDVPQGRIELVAGGSQCSAGDRKIDQRGIGHVVGGVLRESGVKQDLGLLRILLPHQAHVDRFGALHRDQGGNLPTLRWRTAGIGIRERALGKSARRKTEREPHQRARTYGCKSLHAGLLHFGSFHRTAMSSCGRKTKAEGLLSPKEVGKGPCRSFLSVLTPKAKSYHLVDSSCCENETPAGTCSNLKGENP